MLNNISFFSLMQNKQPYFKLATALLVSLLSLQSFANIDSTINSIHLLNKEMRLDAYSKECRQASASRNTKKELRLLNTYNSEANKQADIEHQTEARTLRLYAFYNNNLTDSLQLYIDNDLKLMQANEQWVSYFACRALIVERLLYDKKIHSALAESKKMYDFANDNDIEYGKGYAGYLLGASYQSMGEDKEAAKFFLEAEKNLSHYDNPGQLHNLYGMAWQSFSDLNKPDKQLELTGRWETMWLNYCEQNNIPKSSIAPYYIVCVLSRVDAHIQKNELATARKELDEAQNLAVGLKDISKLLLLKYEAIYEESVGNYSAALKHLKERHRLQILLNNKLSTIDTHQMSARILTKMGKHKQATEIYDILIPLKDSLNQINQTSQLNELGTIYRVNELQLENAKIERGRNIAFLISIIFLVLLISYGYVQNRLKSRNIIIFKQIQTRVKMEEQVELLENYLPLDNQTSEKILFKQIKKLLQQPECISNPTLDRNKIADLLDSNVNDVSLTIKNETGMKPSEFINKTRVNLACELLDNPKGDPTHNLWEQCGFTSRSTFYRIFKENTGISPRNYKETAQN